MVLTSSGATRGSRKLYSTVATPETMLPVGGAGRSEGLAGRFAALRGRRSVALAGIAEAAPTAAFLHASAARNHRWPRVTFPRDS